MRSHLVAALHQAELCNCLLTMRFDTAPLFALQLQALRIAKLADLTMPTYIETPEQWNQLRLLITKLYIDDGLTLPKVMEEVERRGLRANPGMFKQRLAKWGLTKYRKREEVELILRVKRDRENQGLETIFMLRGREVDMLDVERYRKRNHIQISDLPISAADLEKVPDLKWRSPPASLSSESESLVLTPPSSSDGNSPRSLPLTMTSPTSLGHCEEFLRDTSIAFELFIMSGFWDLSQSTEMPWAPRSVEPLDEPMLAEYYWQDECFRHLDNGSVLAKKKDVSMAFKEWNEAFFLIRSIVKAAHYNTLLKLLACIRFLDQENHPLVARMFRVHVGLWAQQELPLGDPNRQLYSRLQYLAPEDTEHLQMLTLEFLVTKLETFLGAEAFTSFEHRLVLNEKKLAKDPSLALDALIPTNEEASLAFGPLSSKTLLALNMRNGILQYRGMREEARETILTIIENASMVEDPAKRLWHLGSAWISLARLQSDLGDFKAMRISLKNASDAEGELRAKHGVVKLGEGEMNWILETLGLAPVFRDAEVDELGIGTLSLS